MLNAFATKLLSRKFVILFASLVDECADPQQLNFVIATSWGSWRRAACSGTRFCSRPREPS